MTPNVHQPAAKHALRLCLSQLLDECLASNLKLPALHIRLAIMELEDGGELDYFPISPPFG